MRVNLAIVALYVSAWIEIQIAKKFDFMGLVALYVSAWIEINIEQQGIDFVTRRTLCECVD